METLSQYVERYADKAVGYTVAPPKGRKAKPGTVTVYLYTHAADWEFDKRGGWIGGATDCAIVTDDGANGANIHGANIHRVNL